MDAKTWNERREFIHDEVYQILHDTMSCGPFDGGCLVVANALKDTTGGDVVVLVDNRDLAEHAALYRDGMLWDFDGALPPGDFIKRFNELEGRNCVGFRLYHEVDLEDAFDEEALRKVSELFSKVADGLTDEPAEEDVSAQPVAVR